MCIGDIKLFGENEKQLEIFIQTIYIYVYI